MGRRSRKIAIVVTKRPLPRRIALQAKAARRMTKVRVSNGPFISNLMIMIISFFLGKNRTNWQKIQIKGARALGFHMGLKREAGEKPLVSCCFLFCLLLGGSILGVCAPALETHKSVIFSQITHTHTSHTNTPSHQKEIRGGNFFLCVQASSIFCGQLMKLKFPLS